MLMRMLKAYVALAGVFRSYLSPIITFCGLTALHLLISAGMVLDRLFFPSLRKVQIKEPVVIVGNPRSGTTFLQRFLVQNGFGTGMRIWKMLFPSLTVQFFTKPLIPLLEKISPARFHTRGVHQTSLTDIETDDPALLFRFFDGLFVYGFFLAWAKEDPRELFNPRVRDTSERDFNWIEKIWERNLLSENQDRIVAKLFSLGIRIPHFLSRFPDAKIIYLIRDPLEAVPSSLSLLTGVLDNRFGFWNLDEDKREQYFERLYSAFLEMSMYFYNDFNNGNIPKENIMIISYDQLMHDFGHAMSRIIEFTGMTPDPVLMKNIQDTAVKQRAYQSEHEYDLARFGLESSRIREDYTPLYSAFLNQE